MRDSEIYKNMSLSAQRSALAFKHYQFVDARLQAIESLFVTMKLWLRLWYCVFPGGGKIVPPLKKLIDDVHLGILRNMEAEHEEAVKKAREEARKPKIQVVSTMNGHA